MKKIGILGGMGPFTSNAFLEKILKYSQKYYGAIQDEDFPLIHYYSLPLKGFDESGIVDEKLVFDQLKSAINFLEKYVDFIVMPCNTIHYFIDEIREISKVPIISIIESVEEEIKNQGYKNFLLLASKTTYEKNLYSNCILPNEKDLIENLILEIMSGKVKSLNLIIDLIKSYNYIDCVILGCTELPLVIDNSKIDLPIVDSLDILAKKSVDYIYS